MLIAAKSAHERRLPSGTLFNMRLTLLVAPAILFAAVSLTAQAPTSVESRVAAQNELFEQTWQQQLKLSPTQATAVGDYNFSDQRLWSSIHTFFSLVSSCTLAQYIVIPKANV